MQRKEATGFTGRAFGIAAGVCLAAALAAPVPAQAGDDYWSGPSFIGPPKGMFHREEIQEYYEDVLWPDTMRAREVWAGKKTEVEDLPTPTKLGMLRDFRLRLSQIERIRDLMEDDSPVDRMSRGLMPNDAYGEGVKFEI